MVATAGTAGPEALGAEAFVTSRNRFTAPRASRRSSRPPRAGRSLNPKSTSSMASRHWSSTMGTRPSRRYCSASPIPTSTESISTRIRPGCTTWARATRRPDCEQPLAGGEKRYRRIRREGAHAETRRFFETGKGAGIWRYANTTFDTASMSSRGVAKIAETRTSLDIAVICMTGLGHDGILGGLRAGALFRSRCGPCRSPRSSRLRVIPGARGGAGGV